LSIIQHCANCLHVIVIGGWPSIWDGIPLTLRSLHITPSQAFLSQLKVVLFGRVGVGSASE